MPDDNQTRLTLVQRLQRGGGDEHCWEDFVATYESYIYVIIRNFNLSTEICDDLLQEVLLRLWKDIPKFEYRPHKCRFRSWLGLVSRNIVKDYLKSAAARNHRSEVELQQALVGVEQLTEPEVEAIAEREWKIFIARLAWEKTAVGLPEKQRAVFEMVLDDFDDNAIAAELSIALSSVRVYRLRSRQLLIKEIVRLGREFDA